MIVANIQHHWLKWDRAEYHKQKKDKSVPWISYHLDCDSGGDNKGKGAMGQSQGEKVMYMVAFNVVLKRIVLSA